MILRSALDCVAVAACEVEQQRALAEVDVVGFLTELLGHVRDWIVMPLVNEIGRTSKTP